MTTVTERDPFAIACERLNEMAKTDPQLGQLLPSHSLLHAILEPGLTIAEIVAKILSAYADRPAYGMRSYEIETDPISGRRGRRYVPEFTTITYNEVRHRIESLANAWGNHVRHGLAAGEFVVSFGYTSQDLAIVDIATNYAQVVSVPLQANVALNDLNEIFGDTQPAAIVTSVENLQLAVDMALTHQCVRSIVVIEIDLRDDTELASFEAAQATLAQADHCAALTTLDELIEYGEMLNWRALPKNELGLERLAVVMYTSGSTGTPKGAMLIERTCLYQWLSVIDFANLPPTISMTYAPMNHLMGRFSIFGPMSLGGTVYFTLKSDMSALLEDVKLVRPTGFSLIPRVGELIYQHYQSEVQRLLAIGGYDEETAHARVRHEMGSSFLGNRLRHCVFASAPLAPEVREFLRDCFKVAFREGYALTEGGGALTSNNRIVRKYVTDYKLRDVPELGYYTTDKPYPRGELLYKSTLVIPGYFKRPEATAALYDADGFQVTGDIVEERGPDHIVWLDRRNNVLKLSQGEFVAVGPLEAAFAGTPEVRQIYLYGSAYRSYILAVVVPDMEILTTQLGREPEPSEVASILRAALLRTGQSEGLKSFEIPRQIIVEFEPFSFENGLLSSVRKPLRPKLKAKYGPELEALYTQIERQRQDELIALRDPSSGLSILERVVSALRASQGITEIDVDKSFTDIGGDSLGSVSFALLLDDIFQISVPVGLILNPTGSLRQIAKFIENAGRDDGQSTRPVFAKIHGPGATTIHADDLNLPAFLGQNFLDGAATLPPRPVTRTVLITGANGYLGHFLCMEWLERLAPTGGKVICVIRANDAQAGRRRLEEAFGETDPVLAERFRRLAAQSLEILSGDLTEQQFGLVDADYARLADAVDQIVHPAALVNHMLSYENLFEPNVVATAELIRFALTGRQKRIDYVSTLAVAMLLETDAPEDGDIRRLKPSVELSDRYASGYAASKWAAEVLLREANEKYGLPVNVFRADMILAHSFYQGQINLPDMFTRLLYSVAMVGLAPASFYEPGPDGSRAEAHYDGLPVDFVAAAMVGIGVQASGGFHSYNIRNSHDEDGVSLDRIIDWVESAGYKIEREQAHSKWLERFSMKLRALPEAQRVHSAVAILSSYARPQQSQTRVFSSSDFEAKLRNPAINLEVPHLSEAFIHKCLNDLRRRGILPV